MSSVRRPHGRLFQIRGPAAPKLLSPKLFAPNRGFSGSANLTVSFKLTPDQPLLPWQQIVAMKHKISYNSACIEDTPPIIAPKRGFQILAPSRGFSMASNPMVTLALTPDRPWLPWQRKFENVNRTLAITGLLWEICS